ncbi:MAG: hypothetical protein WCG27_08845 [Pseudomonadota bacterium]
MRPFIVIFSFIFLLILCHPLRAQNVATATSANVANAAESTSSGTLDQAMDKFKEEQEKLLQYAEDLKKKGIDPASMGEMLKALSGSQIPTSQGPMSFSQFTENTLTTFRQMSHEDLVKALKENLSNRFPPELIEKHPQLIEFIARMLRDHLALPALVKLIEKRQQLMYYGIFFVVTFILGIAWRHNSNKKTKRTMMQVFGQWMVRIWTINLLRLGFFLYLFYDNLYPTWRVVVAVFFASPRIMPSQHF